MGQINKMQTTYVKKSVLRALGNDMSGHECIQRKCLSKFTSSIHYRQLVIRHMVSVLLKTLPGFRQVKYKIKITEKTSMLKKAIANYITQLICNDICFSCKKTYIQHKLVCRNYFMKVRDI